MPYRHEFGGYRQAFIGLILFVVVAGTALPAAAQDPIHWSVARTNKDILRSGELFEVELTAQMDPAWHLYALTQPLGGPQPLVITIPPGRTFSLAGEVSSWLPKSSHDPNFNIETQFFEERALFTLPVETALFTKEGVHRLAITVGYQTCNDRLCLPPREEELTLDVVIGNPGVGSAAMSRAPIPAVSESRSPAPVARVPDMAAASAGSSTLLGYMSLAVVMGALSLLTPCVFPMVPITVSYFTRHAGRSRRDAVVQALFYGLGIILTFTAVGFTIAVGFGASGLNRFAADPWLNLGIMALFVVFAFSLFGIYEMALPSRLVTLAARADSGRGRYIGTMLMGLAFTLTSFTCTVPFLGAVFVVASQGNWQWPLAGMLAFSYCFRDSLCGSRSGAATSLCASALRHVADRSAGDDGNAGTGSGNEVSVQRRSGVGLGHIHTTGGDWIVDCCCRNPRCIPCWSYSVGTGAPPRPSRLVTSSRQRRLRNSCAVARDWFVRKTSRRTGILPAPCGHPRGCRWGACLVVE